VVEEYKRDLLILSAETKVLKQRVRDYIDPGKDLGHSDKGGKKKAAVVEEEGKAVEGEADEGQGKLGGETKVEEVVDEGVELKRNADGTVCEDCA